MWKSYFEYYRKFIVNDTNVLTIKFEELVLNPPELCKRMCCFMKEDFDAGMLDTSLAAASVGSTLEPYKQNVARPVDPERAFAWRKDLQEQDLALTDLMLGRDLRWFGYPLARASQAPADGDPADGFAQNSSVGIGLLPKNWSSRNGSLRVE